MLNKSQFYRMLNWDKIELHKKLKWIQQSYKIQDQQENKIYVFGSG